MNNIQNATTAMSSTMSSYFGIGFIVAIIVAAIIFLMLFLLIKNFRKTIYGVIFLIPCMIIAFISKYIGKSTQEQNYIPIKWFVVEDSVWDEHCLKIGKIHHDVCWKNRANAEEIWRLGLFEWTNEERTIYEKISEEIKGEKT